MTNIIYKIVISKWFKYLVIGLILAILIISLTSCTPDSGKAIEF